MTTTPYRAEDEARRLERLEEAASVAKEEAHVLEVREILAKIEEQRKIEENDEKARKHIVMQQAQMDYEEAAKKMDDAKKERMHKARVAVEEAMQKLEEDRHERRLKVIAANVEKAMETMAQLDAQEKENRLQQYRTIVGGVQTSESKGLLMLQGNTTALVPAAVDNDDSASSEPPTKRSRREASKLDAVVAMRTTRVLVIFDGINDDDLAPALASVEGFGVQNVWIIGKRRVANYVADIEKKETPASYLTVRRFESASDCAANLDDWNVWLAAPSDDHGALALGANKPPCFQGNAPSNVAIVISNDAMISTDLRAVAQERCYVPLLGFTPRLHLSATTGLLLHNLFTWFPNLHASADDHERNTIRQAFIAHERGALGSSSSGGEKRSRT